MSPPREGMAYSWSQPVFFQGKTSSSRVFQSRLPGDNVGWKTLPAPASETHRRRPSPFAAFATQIDHGSPARCDMKTKPFSVGTRMKATCEESAEIVGDTS